MAYHESIKTTVLEFVKDLKDNVFTNVTEQGELALVEFWFQKMTPHSVANHVVSHVLPYEKEIKTKNVMFFIKEKDNIFKGLPSERIEYFSQLVTLPSNRGGMSDDDKNTVWVYFQSLVGLAKEYKKNK